MPDLHYTHPRLAALYDIECGWSRSRDFYMALASQGSSRILDLGCGTGLLCHAFAALGHEVTGVDPAEAMIDVAREKPNGGQIEWVRSEAQLYNSSKNFDLIVMTGHAFQALVSDDEIEGTLSTMAQHLSPGGIAVFESRNPRIEWAREWIGEYELDVRGEIVNVSRRVLTASTEQIIFDTIYEFSDETLTSRSNLRFLSDAEIRQQIFRAGMEVVEMVGDWDSHEFAPLSSREMIYVLRRATEAKSNSAKFELERISSADILIHKGEPSV